LIQSILKALDILEAFTEEEYILGVTDLSERLGYPKGTVHNILKTLESRGYIEADPVTSRYSLGLSVLKLSNAVRANIEIRDRAEPLLRELAEWSQEIVYLTVLHNGYSVYVGSIEAPGRLPTSSALGLQVPLHCTSVGKAKMAFLSEEEIDCIIERIGLQRFTPSTITDPAELKAELALVRERGYAVDREEHEVGVQCVGAPIRNERGSIVASCSVSGPAGRITDARTAELAPKVMEIAAEISRRLGYRGRQETGQGV
jgi:DNA-binding IclR family transcriptional regulator